MSQSNPTSSDRPRVFVSCLGTSDYQEAEYTGVQSPSHSLLTRFIQLERVTALPATSPQRRNALDHANTLSPDSDAVGTPEGLRRLVVDCLPQFDYLITRVDASKRTAVPAEGYHL